MRIALCDDSAKDRAAIGKVLQDMGFVADTFQTGEELQAAFWKEAYDLVLLDIEMPNLNGYELAALLKKQNTSCEIIFITDHLELILRSFQFKPAAFVPKNLLEAELPKALKRVMKKAKQEAPVYVTKRKSKDRIAPLKEVVYLKYVYDHEVEFTLRDGSHFSETGTMKEFESELAPHGFVRIFQSCIVNMLYIARLEKDLLVLTTGEQFTVARERRASVRQTYMEYLMQ